MARVLLVSYAGYPYSPSSLMPDNGLAGLAGALLDAGHEALVLDYGTLATLERLFPPRLGSAVRPLAERLFVEGRKLSLIQKLRFMKAGLALDRHQGREAGRIAREVAEQARTFGADVVGLKLWNGDGFAGSVRIAEAVRQSMPNVSVLGGGPQVDYFQKHILDHTNAFDAVVAGEGERVLPELVDAITTGAAWRAVSGVIHRDGARIVANPVVPLDCLDDLPLPSYDGEVYPSLTGDGKVRIGVVDESRGCPNRCAFCIHPIKSGGSWHVKSPERVVAEMRRVMTGLDTRYFIYSGSNTSAKVAIDIAHEIVRQGLDVRYGCFGHVRGIARADFDLLRRSGCEAIFYGLESASPRILKEAFNKPLNLDEAERVLQDTAAAGIRTIASIIFPAPFEDDASRAETLDFLRRVRPDSVPVTIPGLIPGTAWEQEAARFGFEKLPRRDIWEDALTYKIKLLFPPSMWKPLPYTLNGKTSKQLFRECEGFMDEVEGDGLLTNVSHELVLMANALGEGDDLRGFRDRCRARFLSGDVAAIADMVSGINANVQPGIASPAGSQT